MHNKEFGNSPVAVSNIARRAPSRQQLCPGLYKAIARWLVSGLQPQPNLLNIHSVYQLYRDPCAYTLLPPFPLFYRVASNSFSGDLLAARPYLFRTFSAIAFVSERRVVTYIYSAARLWGRKRERENW